MEAQILVIDDEIDACELFSMVLEGEGANVVATTSVREALDAMSRQQFDVVLTDLTMQDMNGLEVCERVLARCPNVPVVVVTGQGSMDAAIAVMRAGAYDLIIKPIDPKLLSFAVLRAVRHHRVNDEVKRLRDAVQTTPSASEGMIGSSRAMRLIYETISCVADGEASILIRGETGVGKEVVARRIHSSSPRKSGPFVAINCAAVTPTLLESELFGHAKGAFTDARSDRTGLFVQANRGTLFLDEIGELPLALQPKLLRALQERRVRPVGANIEVPFDARVIAASNRHLEDEVEENRFREDLYYRINVVSIDVPPLRERENDALELAQHFLAQHASRSGRPLQRISAAAAEKLAQYRWPGNVRELENCISRAVAFAREGEIGVDCLPENVRSYRPDPFVVAANDSQEIVTITELERRYIQRVLALVGGNKSRAAHLLGIDRRTLYRKAEKWAEKGSGADTRHGNAASDTTSPS
jgi:two-component system response regulator HydG